jgi:hypothetical protein
VEICFHSCYMCIYTMSSMWCLAHEVQKSYYMVLYRKSLQVPTVDMKPFPCTGLPWKNKKDGLSNRAEWETKDRWSSPLQCTRKELYMENQSGQSSEWRGELKQNEEKRGRKKGNSDSRQRQSKSKDLCHPMLTQLHLDQKTPSQRMEYKLLQEEAETGT